MIALFRKLLTVLAVVGVLTACGNTADGGDTKLKVVATFSVLGDIVANVGGDKVALYTLVGPGADAHTFEPSPADSRTLVEAALVFENGLGFESWLDDLYTASGSEAKRIVVTQGIEPLTLAEPEHGGLDPHMWHDVANGTHMVKNIAAALAQADPANAAFYQANAESYMQQLKTVDEWVIETVEQIPPEGRKLITTHDTFGYFAHRYGFEIIGTVLPGSTEGASPSAQEVAALVEAVKAAGVPALFAENVSSNALLRQIADEAGVEVVASLYTDALGPPGSDGDTYIDMMRSNVTTIVTELSK